MNNDESSAKAFEAWFTEEWNKNESGKPHISNIGIKEALYLAWEHAQSLKVKLPSQIHITQELSQQKYSFAEGWNACLDALKLSAPDREDKKEKE